MTEADGLTKPFRKAPMDITACAVFTAGAEQAPRAAGQAKKAIQAGLGKLTADLLARPWGRTDGAALHACPPKLQRRRVERLPIDSGYVPAVASAVAVKAGPAVPLSKGMGLRARNKPMASYTHRPGERHGHNWPLTRGEREAFVAALRRLAKPCRASRAGTFPTYRGPASSGTSPSTPTPGRPSSTPGSRRFPGTRAP